MLPTRIQSSLHPNGLAPLLFNTLCAYASDQCDKRNSYIHGATLQANQAKYSHFLISNITTVYQNQHLVNIADQNYLFGLPLLSYFGRLIV